MRRVRKALEKIGFIAVMMGTAAMDSPSVAVPVGMIVAGAAAIAVCQIKG